MIFFQFSLLDILNKIKKIVFNLISDLINRIKTFRSKKDLINDSEIEIPNQVFDENINPELLEDEFPDSVNEDLDSDILSADNQEDINIDSGVDRLDEDIYIEEEVEEEYVDIDTDEARKKKYFKYNLPKSSLLNESVEVGNKYSEAELHQKSEAHKKSGTFLGPAT